MGWDGTYKPASVPLKQFVVDQINGTGTKYEHKVLDICVRPFSAAYAAVERTHLMTGAKEVYGLVVAIRHSKDGYVWTKMMDEDMGPYYTECPARILDLLSPTTDESALKWRGWCRDALAARDALKKDLDSAREGTVFRFLKPAKFTRGDVTEMQFHTKSGRQYAFLVGRYAFYASIERLLKLKDWYGLEVVR